MKQTRNYWPLGIVLTFVLFISGIATLVVLACRNPSDLVSATYYEEEVRYQSQIDGMRRAESLEGQVRVAYDAQTQRITVGVPLMHVAGETKGTIRLYRPSASGLDREVELKPDANGRQVVDVRKLEPGLWKVTLLWTAAGMEYRVDEKVVIVAKS